MLQTVVQLLHQAAFSLWGVEVSWAELLGDVSGVLCVWLVARQRVWNWPLGLLNNVFWSLLFWRAKLYADSLLQGVFFVLGVYGWWVWVFGGGLSRNSLPVRTTTRAEWWWLSVAALLGTVGATRVLAAYTDSPVPLWDAAVLTLSLVATYGQAQKLLESWWVWIAVDVISVPLYVARKLYPTAALYGVFLGMCAVGLLQWQRALRSETDTSR